MTDEQAAMRRRTKDRLPRPIAELISTPCGCRNGCWRHLQPQQEQLEGLRQEYELADADQASALVKAHRRNSCAKYGKCSGKCSCTRMIYIMEAHTHARDLYLTCAQAHDLYCAHTIFIRWASNMIVSAPGETDRCTLPVEQHQVPLRAVLLQFSPGHLHKCAIAHVP